MDILQDTRRKQLAIIKYAINVSILVKKSETIYPHRHITLAGKPTAASLWRASPPPLHSGGQAHRRFTLAGKPTAASLWRASPPPLHSGGQASIHPTVVRFRKTIIKFPLCPPASSS
jgi:hypothetical protein